MKRVLSAFVCVLCCAANVVWAQATLSHVTPQAVHPGATTEITLHGDKLDPPVSVWTSFPATVEIVPPADGMHDPKKIVCRMTLGETVPVGIGGVIATSAAGVSDTVMLMIDDLPTTSEQGGITSIAAAQEINLPTAVDGVSDGSQSDFYKFNVTAGQRITASVFARRMASAMDPVMWLRDMQGNELAYVDDDPGVGVDCRLSHLFDQDGQYVLEVRDNSFRGGLRYRLRVGDFPIISSAYPLGGQLGQPATFSFTGPATAGIEPTQITVPAEVAGGEMYVGAKYKGGSSSALVPIVASSLVENMETEPNDDPAAANAVTVPCAINGQLQATGDRDHFKIDAKKGERVVLRSFSQSLGSPAYVKTRIARMDGSQLAESPVTDAGEESLAYTFPEDGSYLVLVEDLLHRGGPEFTYRVAIEPSPGFSLALKHDPAKDGGGNGYKIASSSDGAFAIEVEAKRDGYNGPITLSVESPNGPYTVFQNVIPENQPATKLIAALPSDMTEGSFLPLRIVGRANVNGKDVAVEAQTFNVLRTKWKHVVHAPGWHDGMLALGLTPAPAPFFNFNLSAAVAYIPRGSGKAVVRLTPERTNGEFKDPLTVIPLEVPAPLQLAVKQNEQPPSENYELALTAPADMAEAEHKIRVLAFGQFGGRGQKVVKEFPVRVVTPMTLSVTPAGPVLIGQKQKLKVAVSRFSEGDQVPRQPITIRCAKLPPGVTGPGDITFAAAVDQFELDLEVTAAADAAAGTFNELVVEAVTNFQGQDISIQSAPTSLEVQPAGQ